MCEVEQFDEISNFCESSEEEGKVDEFKDVGKRIEKFEETLHPIVDANNKDDQNSFVYAILYALRFDISEKVKVCTEKELHETIGADLFLKLFENRDKFKLELNNWKFNLLCMEINDVLADSSYFLRVYKLRKKIRYVSLKSPKKQTIVRQLSSCVNQKFNGFNIVSVEHGRKLRKKFKPFDLVYKPVRKPNEQIKCYFSRDLSKAYRNTCSRGEKLHHGFENQCYYCNKFFPRSDKYKRHTEHCSGVPGIACSFNNQNLVTFEDNLGYKGDLLVVAYIDFETTAPTSNCFDPEEESMFPVGTRYCSDIGFLLDLHRDTDQLRIEIEMTLLYDIFFQHHNDVIATT